MITVLIFWTLFSFIFLISYVGSQKYYENSDIFNLWINAICFPAFLITFTVLSIGEYIEKIKERGNNNG